MRFRSQTVAVAAALSAVVGLAPVASALSANLDPVHSMIVFRIGHSMASAPFGVFHGIEGTVTADSAIATPTAVSVTAHLAKLDMGNADWEKHIKSGDFFDAAKYPDVTFKSTQLKATGDDTFDATGTLTMHGVTKTVTVKMQRLGVGKGMKGETRIGYSTEFKVSRKDFGITAYEGPVGDEVTLMVNLEGVVAK